jgi:NAD(P)H-flavin reductase
VPLVTAPILDIVHITPRSRLLAIGLLDDIFHFAPGQALLLARHEEPEKRPYSIACSPERAKETSSLEVLIALDADGNIGSHLPAAAPGTLVDIDGPFGSFVLPSNPSDSRLLFVAGGTGIAPLRAMIDHVLRRGPPQRLSVLYSARRSDEFAFIEELREHERQHRIELHQTVTREDRPEWAGGRGRIGRKHFEAVLHDPAHTLCFVCGPPAFVGESMATLLSLGVPGDLIRTEGWGPEVS